MQRTPTVLARSTVMAATPVLGFSSINPIYKQALLLYFKALNVFSV
jgi:hypothetical protein